MCLLITQPATAPSLSDAWLEDFYDYNSDGAGIMYVENGQLHIHKVVPKNAAEFIKLYREHAEGRDCAIHLRFKTHGAIDHENTHPYEVFGQDHPDGALWMMHNGVLSTGNKMDPTKSDTWCFIREYLRPMLDKNRDLLYTSQFQVMLGAFIGNNRFVFMDEAGRTVTINEHQGTYWGGRWMSNTYAWTAPRYALSTDGGYTAQEIAQLEVDEPPQRRALIVAGDPRTATKSRSTSHYDDEYGYGGVYGYDGYGSSSPLLRTVEYSDEETTVWDVEEIAQDMLGWLASEGYVVGVTVDQVCDYVEFLGDNALYDLAYELRAGHILEADFAAHIVNFTTINVEESNEETYEEDYEENYEEDKEVAA